MGKHGGNRRIAGASYNPWEQEALGRAGRSDEPEAEAVLIAGEYARHSGQEGDCLKCGGALFWKVTIGARKCVDCGAVDL